MRAATEQAAFDEAKELLAMLRGFGVGVRANPTTYGLAWKPKFSAMPAEWQDDIREHGLALVRLLWPSNGQKVHRRPGWYTGTVAACVGCGAGTALYDPLGQPRHHGCGFIGQHQVVRVMGHQGKALRMRQQGG